MALDLKRFMAASMEPRTAVIPVAGLAPFFDQGEKPEWTVRGLAGAEFARVREAVQRNDAVEAMVTALQGQTVDPNALRELLGLSNTKQPIEVIRRIEMLVAGSVAPKISHDVAVKIASCFPADFYVLTDNISVLSGLGHVPGKPEPSGSGQT